MPKVTVTKRLHRDVVRLFAAFIPQRVAQHVLSQVEHLTVPEKSMNRSIQVGSGFELAAQSRNGVGE